MAKDEKKKLPACDVRMTGSDARIILKNGTVRAGQVVAEWADALMLTTLDGQTAIIYRDAIAELWEGLGPNEEEKKGEVTK